MIRVRADAAGRAGDAADRLCFVDADAVPRDRAAEAVGGADRVAALSVGATRRSSGAAVVCGIRAIGIALASLSIAGDAGVPNRQEEAQVGAVNVAVAVHVFTEIKVCRAGGEPGSEQEAEVGTVNGSVLVDIGLTSAAISVLGLSASGYEERSSASERGEGSAAAGTRTPAKEATGFSHDSISFHKGW